MPVRLGVKVLAGEAQVEGEGAVGVSGQGGAKGVAVPAPDFGVVTGAGD